VIFLAYGKPRIMNEYYNIYNHLENLIEKEDNNPEHLLYKYLNKLDIKYKKIDINYSVILSLCKTIAITGDSGSGKSTLSEFIKSSIKTVLFRM